MATARGYKHLSFSRLRDLVAIQLPEQLDEMTYVANASNFRRALLNTFSRPDWDWQTVSQSEDVCLTYRGYIKFLEMDLQTVYPVGDDRSKTKYKRGVEYIAQQMMARGDVSLKASLLRLTESVAFTDANFRRQGICKRSSTDIQGLNSVVDSSIYRIDEAFHQPITHRLYLHHPMALCRRLYVRRNHVQRYAA